MIKYDSYKSSGIEWLGEIPSHWDIKKIGQSFFERKEKVSDKDFAPLSVTKKGVVPQLDNAAKSNAGDDRKKVLKGDFVINSRSDRKGSSGVSPLDGSVSLISIVLEPKDLNGKYIHNLLRSYEFTEEFYRNGQGIVADLWSTKYSLMKSIYIPIPPKKEQVGIANFLDKKLEQVDNYISKQKELIELLKEKKSSLINQAVTKGLDSKVEYKESDIAWLGKIPKHWEVKKLKTFCNFINRGLPPNYIEESDYKVVNQATISKGYFDETSIKYHKFNLKNDNRGLLKYNDILIASTGGGVLGKVYLYKENGNYIADSHLTILRDFKQRFIPAYIFFWLSINFDLINGVLSQGSTNQIELQKNWLKNMFFCFPPKKEQKQIVEYIEKESSKIDKVITTKEDEIKLLDEYKQSLISSVVTGKIKVS
ncbi:restriction endonuclease subunit S [Halarcobacter ebronensis]|uniref:Restriction endonuclease subunit S n=1 Tax=Halarcobacter ebronensis TaxID=1462615 RepID=A0A4Q0YCW9_9BACT|nr:restriction endonuclease subunit S [Halarcobacter ebronensis]RXJ68280.1 restriction endonuclease subunit S [Halarcobacter ebronensis]